MPTGRRSGGLYALAMLAVIGCSYRRSSLQSDASDAATHDSSDEAIVDGGDDAPADASGDATADAGGDATADGTDAATDARDGGDEPEPLPPLPPGGGDAVAYQIDAAHTGNQPDSTLTPPLRKRWSIDLGGPISYPLIAGGRVFVTVGNVNRNGSKLHAIDLSSGIASWVPIEIPGDYPWSNAAYDEGRIYVLNANGVVTAFEAETGARKWSVQMPKQSTFSSPPTAMGGFVFVGGGTGTAGTVYRVEGATGDVKWTAPVVGGDNSSPAVSSDGVYVSYGCVQAYAFKPADGMQIWHHTGPCSSFGGLTAALYGGRVWARDGNRHMNLVLDAATGGQLGPFDAGPIPAFAGDRGFFLSDGTLRARTLDLSMTAWAFAGDGKLVSAPIVANGFVYVGSSAKNLWAFDVVTGMMSVAATVGDPIVAPDEWNASQPLTGLAAGGNALLVPAGSHLVCYQ